MAKASTKTEDIKLRFAQAAKFVWAMKSAGKEIPKTYIANTFHIGSNTARFLMESITGAESDIESITEELREKIKVLNREYGESLKPKAVCTPEELVGAYVVKEKPQDVDIEALRKEIYEEVYKGFREREERQSKEGYKSVAYNTLLQLVKGCPKWAPSVLVDKAFEIADKFCAKIEEK